MKRLRDSAPPQKGRQAPIEEHVTAKIPPSIALSSITRHFGRNGQEIDLAVPVTELGLPGGAQRVAVEFESRPSRSFVARYHDRMELQWEPLGGPIPRFRGRLTILPLGSDTEICLKGEYEPLLAPNGVEDARGDRLARLTAQALLKDLQAALEAEFADLKAAMASRDLASSGTA